MENNIIVGLVFHDHGVNIYAGETEELVEAKIVSYCREYWKDRGRYEVKEHSDLSNAKILAAYFEYNDNEYYSIEGVELLKE